MKRTILLATATAVMLLALNPTPAQAGMQREKKNVKNHSIEPIHPPSAKKIKKELTLHNHTRIDNYYWLNQRENPDVINYLNAENRYLKNVMKHTEELQKKLFKEMTDRVKRDDSTVPYRLNGYYYYTRYSGEGEYPIYCRKKNSLEAPEEIIADVNALAAGHNYYHMARPAISPDNSMAIYGVDTVSRRQYTLHFKNLATGQILDEKIPNTSGRAVWAKDNKTVFYSVKDDTLRVYKVLKHRLGTPITQDNVVFHETDSEFRLQVSASKSRDYIFIVSASTLSREVRFIDARQPDGKPQIIQPRQKDLLYNVEHYQKNFYVRTNLDAKNFRLMKTPVNKTEKEHWREIIPHRSQTLLEDFEIFDDYLVLEEREKGLTHLRVIPWTELQNSPPQKNATDLPGHRIDFGEAAYVTYCSVNHEFDSTLLRFWYSSPATPPSTFDYNMKTREKKLMKQDQVAGFNPTDYRLERLYARATDGSEIPISLVYRKNLRKDGKNPLYLYGYGSYGFSLEPWFRLSIPSLLDRGFVFAMAHVRGGQEMGRYWYEDGKLLKKKNTFTDFIACAEYLIKQKYTTPGKLFIGGGSAGGLLVGAAVTMRPELFKGAILDVPFLDVVTTMLDPSIPLTTVEYKEWGNPADKVYYDYMLSYSPYDNIKAVDYPAMLALTGLHDSQVQYWEPAKWTAKLRELKTDSNPLLLRTDMDSGHGGASGRFKSFKDIALKFTFMLDQLGIHR